VNYLSGTAAALLTGSHSCRLLAVVGAGAALLLRHTHAPLCKVTLAKVEMVTAACLFLMEHRISD